METRTVKAVTVSWGLQTGYKRTPFKELKLPVWVEYAEIDTHNVLTLEVRYHDTSFDDLSWLSEAFGTRLINMESEQREDGYCDTCRYSYTLHKIKISGITKWPE